MKIGFQRLNKKERSRIARMGGIAAHKKGTAHKFPSKSAKKTKVSKR